jgi:hypothetical protein
MAECDPREISFFHHDRAFRFHDPPTPLPHRWIKAKPVLTSAQPRGDAAIVRGQARTAPQSAANRNDPAQPAAHLGGPRLASLVVCLANS